MNAKERSPHLSAIQVRAARFGGLLSEENGQPGFRVLDPFLPARAEGPSVTALDIAVAGENGKASPAGRSKP